MKVNDLKNIIFANRIVIVKNDIEYDYGLWSKEETIYKLLEPFPELKSNDLFKNHGEEKINIMLIQNNWLYIQLE